MPIHYFKHVLDKSWCHPPPFGWKKGFKISFNNQKSVNVLLLVHVGNYVGGLDGLMSEILLYMAETHADFKIRLNRFKWITHRARG